MVDGLMKGKLQMERRVNARGFRSCKRDKSAHWTGRGRALMALNGARMEEKKAAAAQVNRAKGAMLMEA